MSTYNLVIATPGSMITAAYVRSLARTIPVLHENNISWTLINYESCYISQARERVINDGPDAADSPEPFGNKFDYDKILWIDSDIEWSPEDVLELYYSERDIVTGAYIMTGGAVAVSYDEKSSPYPQQIVTQRETRVLSCGFGFLCIKKGVFESMSPPWFSSAINEDSAWCARAREAGFDIWLNPNVRVLHHKTMALAWP